MHHPLSLLHSHFGLIGFAFSAEDQSELPWIILAAAVENPIAVVLTSPRVEVVRHLRAAATLRGSSYGGSLFFPWHPKSETRGADSVP